MTTLNECPSLVRKRGEGDWVVDWIIFDILDRGLAHDAVVHSFPSICQMCVSTTFDVAMPTAKLHWGMVKIRHFNLNFHFFF